MVRCPKPESALGGRLRLMTRHLFHETEYVLVCPECATPAVLVSP
jgi:hypothetical protein